VLPVFIRALRKTFRLSLASLSASAPGVITTANRSAAALSQSLTTPFADPFAGLKGRDLRDGVIYTEKKFSGQLFGCFIFRKMIYDRKSAGLLGEFEKKTRNQKTRVLESLPESYNGLANGELNRISSFIARVRITRPKEAFQPVFATSRDNMRMKMRHALADAIVHRHERPVRFHCRFNRAREELCAFEKGPNQIFRQIGQSFVVCFRNQQTMPGKNGPMIEKCERDFVFEYEARRNLASNNSTKQAVSHYQSSADDRGTRIMRVTHGRDARATATSLYRKQAGS
jgi:hypothetical protein